MVSLVEVAIIGHRRIHHSRSQPPQSLSPVSYLLWAFPRPSPRSLLLLSPSPSLIWFLEKEQHGGLLAARKCLLYTVISQGPYANITAVVASSGCMVEHSE
jgi:hypothetical protein